MSTQIEILTALDAELALSEKPERFKIREKVRDGDVWKVWLDPAAGDGGSLDTSLEGARAWWPAGHDTRPGGGDVLAVVPEDELVVLRYLSGPLPNSGDDLWIYPILYLQSLRNLWEDDTFAKQQAAYWATLIPQNSKQSELSVDSSALSWLRQRQREAFQLPCWNVSFLFGPPGTGKTTTLGALLAQLLQQFPDQRILLLSTTNSAVDEALVAVDKSLEQITQSEVQPSALRRECSRIGSHFLAKHYQQRQHLLPATDPKLVKRLVELQSAPPAKQDAQAYHKWKSEVEKVELAIRQTASAALAASRLVAMTTTSAAFRYRDLVNLPQYDLLVFDEASQVSRIHAMTLAKLGKRLLFAGDPRQLAPIVRTKDLAAETWLGTSPFDLMKDDTAKYVCRLNEQSRMAAPISNLVSQVFYGGELQVALDKASDPQWNHERQAFALTSLGSRNTYVIATQAESQYSQRLGGPFRQETAVCVTSLARVLTERLPQDSILILTPYRAQRSRIRQELNSNGLSKVQVSTVHRAQGTERDTIIFDPVQASTSFLNDEKLGPRLMNVAVSRAKARFILIASHENLQNSVISRLARIIENTADQSSAIDIDELAGRADFPSCALDQFVSINSSNGSPKIGRVLRIEGGKLILSERQSARQIPYDIDALRARPAKAKAAALQQELERLKEENAVLKKRKASGPQISYAVSDKGALSIYGLGRFPVTLYKEQWLKLVEFFPEVRRFLDEHGQRLPTRE